MIEKQAEKKTYLEQILQQITQKDCAVAFSGGVDSALLLKMTKDASKKNNRQVYALTMQTMLHPTAEMEHTIHTAEEIGVKHQIISVDELLEAEMEHNPVDRCYRCKKLLFSRMKETAAEFGVTTILDGTNADDLKVYRPGLQAIRELGIQSPFAQAEITKEQIRMWAKEYGLSVSDRPAMPCLATRFPYGAELSYEKMHTVAKGEAYLHKLGFYNVRLRVYDDLLRIEVDSKELEQLLEKKREVVEKMKSLGYHYITLDLEGFRSGSMDIGIGNAYNKNV